MKPCLHPATFAAIDSTPAIQTAGLTRHFGTVRAVDGIDLCVARGCFYGFLGPNGAGKSTTIKMLTGLLAPGSGSMRILGHDPADPKQALEMKRHIGVVPENLALFEYLTAREYLQFVGRMHGMPRGVVDQRSDELLAIMGLDQQERQLALEFSHGMRKKLALAAALIPDPELLFLDEPFEGVDAVASRMLREVLRRCVERGATIFLTSHVLEIVEKLCTDVGIIAEGKLVYQGPTAGMQAGGGSLEDRFIAAVGREAVGVEKLSWLEGGE